MRIGLTYDLREDYLRLGYTEHETADFDSPATIDAIDAALVELGHTTDRIGNVKSLTRRLADGLRWDLVFNIAEGLHGVGREAQVPALLDAFQIPYTFSDTVVLGLTLHKAFTKRLVREMGLLTPDFAVVASPGDIDSVSLPYPLFAKPLACGTSAGISAASRIRDRRELTAVCHDLLLRLHQPVLVERFLPGRELTVGIVGAGDGARALGALEIFLEEGAEPNAYSYKNKNKDEYSTRVERRLSHDRTAEEAKDLALQVYRGIGCRDAGRVDVRCDERGNVNFMEINPIAGLHPVDSDLVTLCRLLDLTYVDLIDMIVRSACERVDGERYSWASPQ